MHVDSYYAATVPFSARPALDGEIDCDVCVIGGGLTGVSAAYHLAKRGYSAALLESQCIGWGASGRNGGQVGTGQRADQATLESLLGVDAARTLWDMGLEAVELVRALATEHDINCDLKRGILHVAAKLSHVADLQREVEHLHRHYAYHNMRFIDRIETGRMLGTRRYFGGQLDRGSAHINPLQFVAGLADAAESLGAQLFERSRVLKIRQGSLCRVSTSSGDVSARYVILGCNGYLEKLNDRMASRIMPINNFVLATEPLTESRCRELIRDDVAVSDSKFVVNYWRISGDNRLLYGGGETYTRRFPRDMKAFVRRHMLKVYPQLKDTRIDYAWGGTLAVTMNRMPSFGRLSENVFYAQGYSGHGVANATFAGKLFAELVSGSAERFDVMASIPTKRFPGGHLMRRPAILLGMLYYALLDRL